MASVNMTPKKKIAVMTSGGDSPGMNAVVRAVVRMAIHLGCDAYCVYEGYQGLVTGDIRQTEWNDVRGYLSEGGTLIGTARCMEFYERPGRLLAAKHMILKGIDALAICGGDGSLTGADKFRSEWPSLVDELVSKGELKEEQVAPYRHLNIVGLVGSIDNDLSGTDNTIGAASALSRICEMVDYIEATASSHQRAFVIEVMGRHCGYLALMAGVATGADFIFIPEKPREDNWQEDMVKIVKRYDTIQHRELGKRKTIVIIAEGAKDRHGAKISSEMVVNLLKDPNGLKLDTRATILGHVQRGGPAVAQDRILATLQGVEAVKTLLEATPESETCFIAIKENKIVREPLMEAVKATQEVAKAIEAQDFAKAMSLRDTEFAEMYNCYNLTTTVGQDESSKLPQDKRMRIGFINVGAPAGGMNAAIRAGVAYCLNRGHEPLAIYNGFAGYVRHHDDEVGAVRPFDWVDVDDWGRKGGSEIGTNRELPEESGMKEVAGYIKKDKFDALFLIGGFEAYHALSQLRKARSQYPELRIPLVLLPATISNNVPGSEYSLGTDTCLNELVEFCDKIKQSASATRRRVFVIETQGGRSGYIAVLASLGVGASAVYIPEEGISLSMVVGDINHLKEVFKHDKGQSRAGRLILVNEKADKLLSAKLIADLIRHESEDRFEARDSIPGHVQQGGVPSPLDRHRAVRLAIRCMQHLEKFGPRSSSTLMNDAQNASVIGIQGAAVVFTPVVTLEQKDTDWKNRRPLSAHWRDMKEISDILGGRPKYEKPQEALHGATAKDVKRGLIPEN